MEIRNIYDQVVYSGTTNENGEWSASLPNGTYTVILTDSEGNQEFQTLTVGDGVTSRVCEIIVSDVTGRTVYAGKTDENGNWSVDLPPGYYIITITDVFGNQTREEHIVQ